MIALGALNVVTGLYILAAPGAFYDNTPGLALMGPFNPHFVRDVGLAFLASGSAVALGAWRRVWAAAMAGAIWPSLHGLFHIQIWAHRGLPFDEAFAFDLVAVIAPAAAAFVLAARRVEWAIWN